MSTHSKKDENVLVFGISMLALFVMTVLAVIDDFIRAWGEF